MLFRRSDVDAIVVWCDLLFGRLYTDMDMDIFGYDMPDKYKYKYSRTTK